MLCSPIRSRTLLSGLKVLSIHHQCFEGMKSFHTTFLSSLVIVLAEGLEPPCDQLPFLDCIRVRGYASILGVRWDLNPCHKEPQSSALPDWATNTVGITGFEPITSWISVKYSNQLSYIPLCGKDKNRTYIQGFSVLCIDHLCYFPIADRVRLKLTSSSFGD